MNKFTIKPYFCILGFLGLLGFIPINGKLTYFSFIFFSFFSFYWWGKLSNEEENEKLKASSLKSAGIMCGIFAMLTFFILFFLDRKTVSTDTIILFGTLGYSLAFTLMPALTYHFNKSSNN